MADATAERRRWDTDERFSGVADASGLAAAVDELAALARRPGWVAEEPEAHLVPHLTSARTGLQVLDCVVAAGGVLDVTARPAAGAAQRDVRREAWALIGAVTSGVSPYLSIFASRILILRIHCHDEFLVGKKSVSLSCVSVPCSTPILEPPLHSSLMLCQFVGTVLALAAL